MQERRKYKRLDIDVSIQLRKLPRENQSPAEEIGIEVCDISRVGMGFVAEQKLEVGSFYDAKITIWTKEVLQTVIEVVRVMPKPDGYMYGATFVGMPEKDALKIDIYQLFHEEEV